MNRLQLLTAKCFNNLRLSSNRGTLDGQSLTTMSIQLVWLTILRIKKDFNPRNGLSSKRHTLQNIVLFIE